VPWFWKLFWTDTDGVDGMDGVDATAELSPMAKLKLPVEFSRRAFSEAAAGGANAEPAWN
jgi:hypothetical protein